METKSKSDECSSKFANFALLIGFFFCSFVFIGSLLSFINNPVFNQVEYPNCVVESKEERAPGSRSGDIHTSCGTFRAYDNYAYDVTYDVIEEGVTYDIIAGGRTTPFFNIFYKTIVALDPVE